MHYSKREADLKLDVVDWKGCLDFAAKGSVWESALTQLEKKVGWETRSQFPVFVAALIVPVDALLSGDELNRCSVAEQGRHLRHRAHQVEVVRACP